MPRFVVLWHQIDIPDRFSHVDFMLEIDGILWTWEMPMFPMTGEMANARRLANHRPMYLDYEGPISSGRGHVRRIDGGLATILNRSEDNLVVDLHGNTFVGRLTGIRESSASFCLHVNSPWVFSFKHSFQHNSILFA